MGIVKYHTLDKELAAAESGSLPSLFLIYGESYLAKQAFSRLEKSLLGINGDSISVETLDGSTTPVGDIVEQVSTFSFLATKKLIVVNRIPLFQTDAAANVKYTDSEYQVLEKFITGGWPKEHTLILMTGQGDRRKKIFKTIDAHGMVIDCTVPSGARKADKDEQRAVLNHVAAKVLKKHGKQMDPHAFNALFDSTGFNLDSLVLNLEKLAAFTADRSMILADDVRQVVVKEKKDPIFNLTNALMERNGKLALAVLDNLKTEGFHVLQIIKTLENLFRKLIRVREFSAQAFSGKINFGRLNFNQFKQQLPIIVKHDQSVLKAYEGQELELTGKPVKKKDIPQDLLLAPNPKNAYPVFQTFQKAEKFSLEELCHIMLFLSDMDFKLKTSSIDAMAQVENLIIRISSKGGFLHAQKNQDRRHDF